MRAVSFQKTPTAILSRAIAGTRGRTLIINLPGNPRAIAKCLVPIIPAIQECMAHLNLPHNKLPTQRRLTRDRKRLESFMQRQEPLVASSFSDKTHAVAYDQKFVKLAAMRDALPLLISAIFADLPVEARILCVGAGTGHELIYLAQKFPQWHFTAVEPSAPMLEICRQKAEAGGIASRCFFHEGYLDSLPPSAAFDAATSLLVSQFILAPEARTDFFRAIAGRLRPGGFLASADLASDITSANYQSLLDVWIRLMRETGSAPEQLEKMRVAYGRDVSVLPLEQVSSIIAAGGFETPVLFLQTGLIHAWYAKRTPTDA